MTYHIAVIPGDGTGPEVVAEGIKVLGAVTGPASLTFEYTYFDLGGERYKRTGETLPDSVISELKQFDAKTLTHLASASLPNDDDRSSRMREMSWVASSE